MNRRSFLKTTAAAGVAATIGAPAILRGHNLNERLDIAVIGLGNRGQRNAGYFQDENIVALCDVNAEKTGLASKFFPKARRATDFRRLFDHEKEFDAVVISTPEHTHAFATLPALQLGKHVYCEKPLTYNIEEARIIRMAARNANVVTQMGTQNHANDNYRRVVELIQSGAIGKVCEAHVWNSRAWGWHTSEAAARAAKDRYIVIDTPKETQPIPDYLNWDLWVGPAPDKPFHHNYFEGPLWYRWWNFGNGTMSDLGSHWIDLPFWALELDAPLTVEAKGPKPHPDMAPASMQAIYEYGARGNRPPVKLTWYQGLEKPQIWKDQGIPQWGSGHLFVGDKGMLLSDYKQHFLLPKDKFTDFKGPDPFIPRSSAGHHQDWVEACKGGPATMCDFEYSGLLTEANHLGNVAYRAGKKLHWDAKNMRATNVPEAEPFIRRDYRKGWSLT
ncbi:Gfo/Idh/MocA family oxidoreductase [Opitutia bacterium ISCC 51]|nr:Gfo/Idh/MocA family oxidoreductase [Opitutae bacterium ISCC 51]QXD30336.1 Gfo/Idh/MocA family oxidoreductase [Opitutae bacterium ISCC 52]